MPTLWGGVDGPMDHRCSFFLFKTRLIHQLETHCEKKSWHTLSFEVIVDERWIEPTFWVYQGFLLQSSARGFLKDKVRLLESKSGDFFWDFWQKVILCKILMRTQWYYPFWLPRFRSGPDLWFIGDHDCSIRLESSQNFVMGLMITMNCY